MEMQILTKSLEDALDEHQGQVDDLLKICIRLTSAAKSWRKACCEGNIVARQKLQVQFEELLPVVTQKAADAGLSWNFDAREYLESGRWRQDLMEAGERQQMRLLVDGEYMVSSPVLVRAQASRLCLQIGKHSWPKLRARVVATELKRIRDKKSNSGNQEFLEHLYIAWQDLPRDGATMATLNDIYERFAQAPGWKKENSRAAFGQQIHALARGEVRLTRDGKRFHLEHPSGRAKEREIFTIYREDGQPVRYYGIEFR